MSADSLKIAVRKMLKAVPGLRRAGKAVAQASQRWWRRRFRHACMRLSEREHPVFVKVGANDGTTGDPCSDILLGKRWRGLLVEPVPYCFERLKQNFADSRFSLERVAVGAASGTSTFYYVDRAARDALPGLPEWYDQLGSFDRSHISRQLPILEPFIREIQVQVWPLSELIRRNGIRAIALLHVDAEGHDYQILKTLDFSLHHPEVILIEHRHLNPSDRRSMRSLLRSHGYAVHDCGADFFAES